MAAPQRVPGSRADLSTLTAPCHPPVWPSILHTGIGVDEDDDSVELPSTVDTKAIHDSPPHLSSQPVCVPRFRASPPGGVYSDESDDESPRSSSPSSLHSSNSSSLSSSSSSSSTSSLSSHSSSSSSCSSSSSSSGTDDNDDDDIDNGYDSASLNRFRNPAAYTASASPSTSIASQHCLLSAAGLQHAVPGSSGVTARVAGGGTRDVEVRSGVGARGEVDRAVDGAEGRSRGRRVGAVGTSGSEGRSESGRGESGGRLEGGEVGVMVSGSVSASKTCRYSRAAISSSICSADSSVTSSTSTSMRRRRDPSDGVTSGTAAAMDSPLSDRCVDSPASGCVTSSTVCVRPPASSRPINQLTSDWREANDEITSTVDDVESANICATRAGAIGTDSESEEEFEVSLGESVDAAIRRLDGDELSGSAVDSTVSVAPPSVSSNSTPTAAAASASSQRQLRVTSAGVGHSGLQKLTRRRQPGDYHQSAERQSHHTPSNHRNRQQQQQRQQKEHRAKQTWWRNRLNRSAARSSAGVHSTGGDSRVFSSGDPPFGAVGTVVRPWESGQEAAASAAARRLSPAVSVRCRDAVGSRLTALSSPIATASVSESVARVPSINTPTCGISSSSSSNSGRHASKTSTHTSSAHANNNKTKKISSSSSFSRSLATELERHEPLEVPTPATTGVRARSNRVKQRAASKPAASIPINSNMVYDCRSDGDGRVTSQPSNTRIESVNNCSIRQQQQQRERKRHRKLVSGKRFRRCARAAAIMPISASTTNSTASSALVCAKSSDNVCRESTESASTSSGLRGVVPASAGDTARWADSNRSALTRSTRKLPLSEILNRENKNSVLRSAGLRQCCGGGVSHGSFSSSATDGAVVDGESYCGQLKLPASPIESDSDASSDSSVSQFDSSGSHTEEIAVDIDGVCVAGSAGCGDGPDPYRHHRSLSATTNSTRVPRLRAVPVPVLRYSDSGRELYNEVPRNTVASSNSIDSNALSRPAITVTIAATLNSSSSDRGRDSRSSSVCSSLVKPHVRTQDFPAGSTTSVTPFVSTPPVQCSVSASSPPRSSSGHTLNRQRQRLKLLRGRRKNIVDPVLLADMEELVQRLCRLLISCLPASAAGSCVLSENSSRCLDPGTHFGGIGTRSSSSLSSVFSSRRFCRSGRRRLTGEQRDVVARRRRLADREAGTRRRCKPTTLPEGESKEQCLPLKKRNHLFTANSAAESFHCQLQSLVQTDVTAAASSSFSSSPATQGTGTKQAELQERTRNCSVTSLPTAGGGKRGRPRGTRDKPPGTISSTSTGAEASGIVRSGTTSLSPTAAIISSLHRQVSRVTGPQSGATGARLQRRWRQKRRLRRSPTALRRKHRRCRYGSSAAVGGGGVLGGDGGVGVGDDKQPLAHVFGVTGNNNVAPDDDDDDDERSLTKSTLAAPTAEVAKRFARETNDANCSIAGDGDVCCLNRVKEEQDTSADTGRTFEDNVSIVNAQQVSTKRSDLQTSSCAVSGTKERLVTTCGQPATSNAGVVSQCCIQLERDIVGSKPVGSNLSQLTAVSSVVDDQTASRVGTVTMTTTLTTTTTKCQQYVSTEDSVVTSRCSPRSSLSQPISTVSTDDTVQRALQSHVGSTINNNNSKSDLNVDEQGQHGNFRRRRRRKANRTGFPSSKRRRYAKTLDRAECATVAVPTLSNSAAGTESPMLTDAILSGEEVRSDLVTSGVDQLVSVSPTSSTALSAVAMETANTQCSESVMIADTVETNGDLVSAVCADSAEVVQDSTVSSAQLIPASPCVSALVADADVSVSGDGGSLEGLLTSPRRSDDGCLPVFSLDAATTTTDPVADAVKHEQLVFTVENDNLNNTMGHRAAASERLSPTTIQTLSVLLSDDEEVDDAILPDEVGPPNDQLLLLRERGSCVRPGLSRSSSKPDHSAEIAGGLSRRYSRSNKKFLVAGLLSSYYKMDSTGDSRSFSSSSSSSSSGDAPEPRRCILPAPCHEERWLRHRRRDFTLPHDLWRLQRRYRGTAARAADYSAGEGYASWNYRKLRANLYYDVKPPSFRVAEPCTCIAPSPPTASQSSSDSVSGDNRVTSDPEPSAVIGGSGSPRKPRPPVGCSDDCINRMMYVECSSAVCVCGDLCQNQRIQRHQWPPELVKVMTPDKGWGVVTQLPIKSGTAILEYLGEIVTESEFKRRMQTRYSGDKHHYCLNLDRGLVIDAHRVGSLARFVNHSCAPNCEVQKWDVNGQYRMVLFAMDDIEAGSELCYDYNFSLFDPAVGQVCRCGAAECRGVIGGRTQRVSQPCSSTLSTTTSTSTSSSTPATCAPSVVSTCKLAPSGRSSRQMSKKQTPVRNRRLPWFGAELLGSSGSVGPCRAPSARELKFARSHRVFLVRNYRHMRRVRTHRSNTGNISQSVPFQPVHSLPNLSVSNGGYTVTPSGGNSVTPEQFRLHLRTMSECGVDSVRTRATLAQLSDLQLVQQLKVAQLLLQLLRSALSPTDSAANADSPVSAECTPTEDQVRLAAEELSVAVSACPVMAVSPHLPTPLSLAEIERQLYMGVFSMATAVGGAGGDSVGGVEMFDYHVRRLFTHQLLRITSGSSTPASTVVVTAARRRYTAAKQLLAARLGQLLGSVPAGFRAAAKRQRDTARLGGEEDVVRCVCNLYGEEGVMIQCERCLVWQHCMCIGADSSVENYLCEQCEPRQIEPEIRLEPQPEDATASQSHYLSLMRDKLQIRQGDCVYVMQGKQVKAAEKAGQLPYRYAEQLQLSPDQLLIFRVEKLWKDERGERYAFGYHYCRPHETFHEPSRRFYPAEVLRSPLHELIPLRLVVGRCWVLDLNTYCKGRPRDASEQHVYVCELRVDKQARVFTRVARGARRAICTRWFAFDAFATRLRPTKTHVAHEALTTRTLSEHAARQAAKRGVQMAPPSGSTAETGSQSGAGRRKKTAIADAVPASDSPVQPEANAFRRRKSGRERIRHVQCNRLESILVRLLSSLPSPPVDLSCLIDSERKSRRRVLTTLRNHPPSTQK